MEAAGQLRCKLIIFFEKFIQEFKLRYLSSTAMGRSSLNGVISTSGSTLSQYSHDENATTSTEEIAKAHNCPYKNDIELVNCIRIINRRHNQKRLEHSN
jgi:hypothetical protein